MPGICRSIVPQLFFPDHQEDRNIPDPVFFFIAARQMLGLGKCQPNDFMCIESRYDIYENILKS